MISCIGELNLRILHLRSLNWESIKNVVHLMCSTYRRQGVLLQCNRHFLCLLFPYGGSRTPVESVNAPHMPSGVERRDRREPFLFILLPTQYINIMTKDENSVPVTNFTGTGQIDDHRKGEKLKQYYLEQAHFLFSLDSTTQQAEQPTSPI